jgi:hypothetical protein
MRKNKKEKKEPEIRQLTREELEQEEKQYQACKRPIQIGWGIYAFAATLYLCAGLFTRMAVDKIPEKAPIVETLSGYRETQEYNDFISEIQKTATDRLVAGEISLEEFDFIIEKTSSDEKFEEFLRGLEDNKYVQKTIEEYDDYKDAMNSIGQKYSALSITALSSLLVATLILAKYRFREMDIEEARKKRDEAGLNSPFEEFRQQ